MRISILKAFSYYYHGITFWIIFYFIFIITVGVNTYNIGVVRYDYKILWNITKLLFKEIQRTKLSQFGNGGCKAPVFRARLVRSMNILIQDLFS